MLITVPKVLVLDAMGVIYKTGDDVVDLLIPFVCEKRGINNTSAIEAAYLDASLGQITADEFWQRVHLSHDLEDEYLGRFSLSDGLEEVLLNAPMRFERLVCLSNDVSRWSKKLRSRFDLEHHFHSRYISADIGCRKPDAKTFRLMLDDLAVSPADVLFVDDRLKNLEAAAALGIQTVHLNVSDRRTGSGHRTISQLRNLLDHIHVRAC